MKKEVKKCRKIVMILLAICVGVGVMPSYSVNLDASAATFDDINHSSVFVKQLPPPDESCTASATASMLRRYSMLRGDANWSSITRITTLNVGWVNGEGLKWSFTYSDSSNGIASISVNHGTLSGNSSNVSTLINLLSNHPEGIVIYNGAHAVILTDYTNGTFYCNDPGYDRSYERVPASQAYSVKPENATAYWYITSPGVSFSNPIVDLGDDFYGVILNKDTWKTISCDDDGFVRIRKETGTANQYWRFQRQSDGSYVISSAATGKALEMYKGDTTHGNQVAVASQYWGGNYQKWNIYAQNGGYILESKHYPDQHLVLDMYNGDTAWGTNIITWPRKNSSNQIWAIYTGSESQLSEPELSVSETETNKFTFSWAEVYGEQQYNLNLYKNSVSSINNFEVIYDAKSGDMFDAYSLSPGTYYAVVEAVNFYQTKQSNSVSFTVEEIDETQWVYTNELPSHVTTDKYEIEYNNEYNRVATTAPDNTWTKVSKFKTEYVNNGNKYESDFELSTSNTRVLDSYYYYHWCGDSAGNYINFAYTDSMNHYDAYYETNAVVEEQSVADGDDSRYTAYKLAWAHDLSRHCYCSPGLTCDSSNSHSTRSCWWYKRYVYQDKKEVVYYNFTKESGWVDLKDKNANSVKYRYKIRENFTILYNANGGANVPETQTKEYDKSVLISSIVPIKGGCAFIGWSTDKNATIPEYLPGDIYSENKNITLYAIWEEVDSTFEIKGTLKTFGNAIDEIQVDFYKTGESEYCSSAKLTGGVEEYCFTEIEPSEYIIKISKPNHITREYKVTVDRNIELDIQLNLSGDLNGDGKVNAIDVARANAHAKGVTTLVDYDFACADVNGDGKVNALDVARMNAHAKSVTKLW